jgi:hypothetical protein
MADCPGRLFCVFPTSFSNSSIISPSDVIYSAVK